MVGAHPDDVIAVRVELWPGGLAHLSREIGRMEIVNDLSSEDLRARGNYRFTIWGKIKRPWRKGRHRGFPRKRLNVWHLIARCLREAGVS